MFKHITISDKALPIILLATLFSYSDATAQRQDIYSDDIATLQVMAGDDWLSPPIIELGGGTPVRISFDELSHTYHRYVYSVTHCESDWSSSEGLLISDYISGFQNGMIISTTDESINTTQIYTHYTLQIPNEECSIKMSGNYRVDIMDDETGDTMLTARFMVVEPLVTTSVNLLTNTDIDFQKSHQQLDLRIDYPSTLGVVDARSQFCVKVWQNDRLDNMVICPPAPQLMNRTMMWTHCRDLIFDGMNEFHKFEILDIHRNSLNVESINWDGQVNNVYLYHDYPRPSYTYDEDADGCFYIRNSDNVENDITTDYVRVHFFLDCKEPLKGTVYLDGVWTDNSLSEKYAMEYDYQEKCYHCAVPLKMGYYSYQYLFIPDGQYYAQPCPTEGSYFQTENKYYVLTYYRAQLDRSDRLVGAATK